MNEWSSTSTHNTSSWCGVHLKHRDNFTFYLSGTTVNSGTYSVPLRSGTSAVSSH